MKILALGDSLTEGYIDNHTSKFYPYTTTLATLLKMAVDNEGVSGERTAPMLSRLKRKKKKYTYAVILAGTNDLDTRTYASTVVKNIIKMHLYCLKHLGVQRSFCLSLPEVVLNSKKRFERKRKSINAQLRAFAKQRPDVVYVPFGEFAATLTKSSFSGNGWHLSRTGYRKMGEFVAKKVREKNDV